MPCPFLIWNTEPLQIRVQPLTPHLPSRGPLHLGALTIWNGTLSAQPLADRRLLHLQVGGKGLLGAEVRNRNRKLGSDRLNHEP